MKELTDKALWRKIKRKDKIAFHQLYDRYGIELFNYGIKITTNQETIKDVIQHLFMDIWERAGTRTIPNHIKAYLLKSFRNNLLRGIKKEQKSNQYNIELEKEPISITDLFGNSEQEDRIRQIQLAIKKLPPRQKEIIHLRYYQGLSNNEIAELIDINPQSTANLIHRSISSLKAIIVNKKLFQLFIITTFYFS